MKEEILHLVWDSGLFSPKELQTVDGHPMSILDRGELNRGSGPDFSAARIELDSIEWAGAVEIHHRSSDWNRHNHSKDSLYNSVILHVVYEHDVDIRNGNGEFIPTFELKGRIPKEVFQRYEQLSIQRATIPCSSFQSAIESKLWSLTMDEMIIQRLERKGSEISLLHKVNAGDWSQTYYALTLGFLGQNMNKLPMLELARKIPAKIVLKHLDEQRSLEALLLGVAGYLDDTNDEYALELRSTYLHFKNLYDLDEVVQKWKTGRVRPENTPLRRIIQFSTILPKLNEAWDALILGEPLNWASFVPSASSYWQSHYAFSVPSKRKLELKLSKELGTLLQINVHVPLLYYYGSSVGSGDLLRRSIALLRDLKPESNRYSRMWVKQGRKASTAADSQAMLELYTQLCSSKKCLNCSIGKSILTRT